MSNIELSLSTLASEINALNKTSKSVQSEMGFKLRAVRALLRERNGVSAGRRDPFGLRAPNGWLAWVKENLLISPKHASTCLQFAADPEGTRKAQRAGDHKRRLYSPKRSVSALRRCWPNLTPEQRDWARQQVIALSKEMP